MRFLHWLGERGTDEVIEPKNGNLIEEFPYLGEVLREGGLVLL
jgi:hypothetical protein